MSHSLTIAEKHALTRPKKLRDALEHYARSVEVFPTPHAHHQLALALALPGPSQNIEDAITSARAAVEGAPNEIRHWHLLGLLLTAQGAWAKAQEILEIGAAIHDSSSETDEPPSDTETAAPEKSRKSESSEGLTARDSETVKGTTRLHDGGGGIVNGKVAHEMILDPNATSIPPSDTILHILPDHPAPTPQDSFEHALQLRLTQMALTEHVEGPEGAETKWVDVFGWIAEQKGTVSETQRTYTHSIFLFLMTSALSVRSSIDTGSRSAVTQPSSVVIVSEVQQMDLEVKTYLPSMTGPPSDQSTGQLQPPPITVTPATPADTERKFPFSPPSRRSFSIDRDASAGKKVQQMLKNRVHKGQEKISTISKKIGHGVVRNGNLRRSHSAPGKVSPG